MLMHGTTQDRLDAIAKRVVTLLSRSGDPKGEMRQADHRLLQAGLSEFQSGPKTTPQAWAHNVFVDNLLMNERLREMRNEFRPELIESLDEMVSRLLPAESE